MANPGMSVGQFLKIDKTLIKLLLISGHFHPSVTGGIES